MSIKSTPDINIIGGGLAGSEAAYQAAERGLSVHLYEMRPRVSTGAHVTAQLAELVCSNSLGSNDTYKAAGLLKEELRMMGSMLLTCAEKSAIPAGSALAVDRDVFAGLVTEILSNHPRIKIIREEVTHIPDGLTIIASGPLTSPALSVSLREWTGYNNLFFFDAIAPVVTKESINMDIAYRASRYRKGEMDEGDYINCPLSKAEYNQFVLALKDAQRIELKEFEHDLENGVDAGKARYFEGCLPIEVMANRGPDVLAFGPLRPVGLRDPRKETVPYAVVQLRQDNLAGTLYNLVGFQTNLTFAEQQRVLRLVPGLENAEFQRFGQMHRNTFIFSPGLLEPTMQSRGRRNLFFAGQITGVEGYMGNIASGLVAAINAVLYQQGGNLLEFPRTTMIGALCFYVTHASPDDFQPMKANFGLLPELDEKDLRMIRDKKNRKFAYATRSLQVLGEFLRKQHGITAHSHYHTQL